MSSAKHQSAAHHHPSEENVPRRHPRMESLRRRSGRALRILATPILLAIAIVAIFRPDVYPDFQDDV